MRMVPAVLGVATVPLSYLTLRALDCRATTALLASVFITFENGLVTQSRHILLDSPLVFFTALTTFFWSGFCNEDKYKPFTTSWWTWLIFSGLSLGAVVSSKWVGLFTIATIGCSTLLQLWNYLGDIRIPPRLFIRHFIARALCLIVLPLAFYMTMFQIHFLILENSGDGDGFMSSEFQQTLGGRGMQDTFAGEYTSHTCPESFHVNKPISRRCYWIANHDSPCPYSRRISSLSSPQLSNWKQTYDILFRMGYLLTMAQSNKLPFTPIVTITTIGSSSIPQIRISITRMSRCSTSIPTPVLNFNIFQRRSIFIHMITVPPFLRLISRMKYLHTVCQDLLGTPTMTG